MPRPRTTPIFARRRSRVRHLAGWLPIGLLLSVAATLVAVRVFDVSGTQATDPGPVHVHALGLDPATNFVFIATHSGLYRLPPEAERAERVGDRRQDTMGFTIAAPDRFLGSGHPDLRDDLPPLLGLIESRDAGRTWKSVSLLGEADFHVLRVSGRHIVGYEATGGRILTSADEGRNWKAQSPPRQLVDLVVSPDSSEILLAAAEDRLIRSRDGGRTWSDRGQSGGLLAWPRRDRLYLVDPSGRTWASFDGGGLWQPRGRIGGAPAAFLAVSAHTLYAATHDGSIKRSSDGGGTWITRSSP